MRLKELVQLRKTCKISQNELAKWLDVSAPFVSMVEGGKRDMPPDMYKNWVQGLMVLRSKKIQEAREYINEHDMDEDIISK
jgi:predicted transcriptional regulator